jgi:group I intron endonuclease
MFGCIYLIINLVNGKKYIGQHNTPEHMDRFQRHLYSVRYNSKALLHNAIRKYGKENFKCERLCVCPIESLGQLEAYYAEQYETYMWDNEPGYNMIECGKPGGKGRKKGYKHSEATRAQISKSAMGRKGLDMTPERRLKYSQANKGKVKTEEHLANISKALTGKKATEETKKKLSISGKDPVLKARRLEAFKKTIAEKKARQSLAET